eukprot:2841677-Rhodomonas_salina.1
MIATCTGKNDNKKIKKCTVTKTRTNGVLVSDRGERGLGTGGAQHAAAVGKAEARPGHQVPYPAPRRGA